MKWARQKSRGYPFIPVRKSYILYFTCEIQLFIFSHVKYNFFQIYIFLLIINIFMYFITLYIINIIYFIECGENTSIFHKCVA